MHRACLRILTCTFTANFIVLTQCTDKHTTVPPHLPPHAPYCTFIHRHNNVYRFKVVTILTVAVVTLYLSQFIYIHGCDTVPISLTVTMYLGLRLRPPDSSGCDTARLFKFTSVTLHLDSQPRYCPYSRNHHAYIYVRGLRAVLTFTSVLLYLYLRPSQYPGFHHTYIHGINTVLTFTAV